ncbi:MAG: hypothetical protein RDV48_23170 [Candidatus Eremiobacteraeota bacterium]|nr:hypothetical protein [Candidatus Eremiobacteraeota bacterium]
MKKRCSGSALLYVLVLSLAILVLATAMLFRFIMTLRTLTHDESYVRAGQLADSGAQIAVLLMRDYRYNWYETSQLPPGFSMPLRSTELARTFPEYSPEALGGTFEVEVEEFTSLYPKTHNGLIRGTYRTIISTGRSGSRSARTAVTVKVTSPLLNYLMVSSGDLQLPGWDNPKINGPIFVNSNGSQSGNVWMWHDALFYFPLTRSVMHCPQEPYISGEIKATGKIYLRNHVETGNTNVVPPGENPWSKDKYYFSGTENPGQLQYQDIDYSKFPASNPACNTGHLNFPRELSSQPETNLNLSMPTTDSLMENMRNKKQKIVVDISGCTEGALAEFVGDKLYISKATAKTVGRVWDKDFYKSHQDEILYHYSVNKGVTDRTALDALCRSEVTWNDPDFAEDDYPSQVQDEAGRDLDGDGRDETKGNYFEVKRIVRGDAVKAESTPGDYITIPQDGWTTVYVKTSNISIPISDGVTTFQSAPPLYVRGNIKGKVVLAYDAPEAGTAAKNRLHTVILSQHEAPDDVEAKRKIAPGPGVPGGIRYSNPLIKSSPDDEGGNADDAIVVVSGGSMNAAGNTGYYQDCMRAENGNKVNYLSSNYQLDESYRNYYQSIYQNAGVPAGSLDKKLHEDFNLTQHSQHLSGYGLSWNHNTIKTPLYGVFIGNESHISRNRVSASGTFIPDAATSKNAYAWQDFRWSSISSSAQLPNGASTGDTPMFSFRFRNAYISDGCQYRLRGSISSLGKPLYVSGGDSAYDYKLQEFQASDIAEEIGLPPSVVVCSWQKY